MRICLSSGLHLCSNCSLNCAVTWVKVVGNWNIECHIEQFIWIYGGSVVCRWTLQCRTFAQFSKSTTGKKKRKQKSGFWKIIKTNFEKSKEINGYNRIETCVLLVTYAESKYFRVLILCSVFDSS